ncbi:MAG: glycosyltransferase family 1 protein [Proteobacteria bacterium]|nr:glycosyltransferase family 1 protein [Pseudomonadota bacterium]
MRIVIVTDAWHPQVNGVVRTLETTANHLRDWGHDVTFLTPSLFRTIPLPTYPDIRLSLFPRRKMFRLLNDAGADAVHIATEGPLGWAARAWCRANDVAFTTSYHTQFPEYLRLRLPLPLSWSYAMLRRFHAPAKRTLVPTASQQRRLQDRGFENVVVWSRGVDTEMFRPCGKSALDHLPRPVMLYLGRVSVEKNLEEFLRIPMAGSKVIIGDGPDLRALQGAWPDAHFLGYKFGDDLVRHLSAADVFVFPSRTDTFGLVLLEAMACGVPVAAYPVTGPVDVVRDGINGALDDDLRSAILAALAVDGRNARAHAVRNSWDTCTADFLNYLRSPDGEVNNAYPLRVSMR